MSNNDKNHLFEKAVIWIALNDGPGDDTALSANDVAYQLTVVMAADVFGKMPLTVARAVVAYRKLVGDKR